MSASPSFRLLPSVVSTSHLDELQYSDKQKPSSSRLDTVPFSSRRPSPSYSLPPFESPLRRGVWHAQALASATLHQRQVKARRKSSSKATQMRQYILRILSIRYGKGTW